MPAVVEAVKRLGLNWRDSRFGVYEATAERHRTSALEVIEAYRHDEEARRLTFESGSQLA